MSEARATDQARVSVSVSVPPAEAFRVFTEEIDLWWRRGTAFRAGGGRGGIIAVEPGVGGRIVETYEGDDGERAFVRGVVTAWEPPGRLAFEWRAVNFGLGDTTWVEVVFAATARGTMVTVTHGGWAGLRPDHPVFHGEALGRALRRVALWWGELATSLREHLGACSA